MYKLLSILAKRMGASLLPSMDAPILRGLLVILSAQQFSTSTRTLNKFVFSLTLIGTPRWKMDHPDEKLTKHQRSPQSLCSAVQYEYTHTQQICFLSHTHRDPSTKDGSSWQEADEGWDILTAKIPLNYMLSSSVWVHTHSTSLFSLSHIGTPRRKMGHLDKKLTKDGTSWQQRSP